MGCTNCNEGNANTDCGCTSQALTINDICNPIVCTVEECSEGFDAKCITYTDADLVCNGITIVAANTNVAQALANITAYFCARTTISADILCGQEVISATGTTVQQALIDIATWFCEAFSSVPVRNKYVVETIFPDADNLDTFILVADYLPCLVASGYCGTATPSLSDIVVTGYWFDSVAGYWKQFSHKDKTEIFVDALGNVVVAAEMPVPLTYPINARIIITN